MPPPRHGHLYRLTDARMHDPAQGQGENRDAAPQRLHVPRQRRAFTELPDHQTGKDYTFSRSLKPLEKFRNVITPVSGLHHPGSLGHHHNCIDIFLTGAKIGAAHRNTISVDQKMAQVSGQHTRYPSMEIALTQGSSPGPLMAFNCLRSAMQPDFRVPFRGTQRGHRCPTESLASQSQRAG